MTPGGSSEEFVRGLLREAGPGCLYDHLGEAARQWIERAERETATDAPGVLPAAAAHLERLAQFFAKRRFAEFRDHVRPRTPLEVALLELFLQCRIRLHVLAYLSVQEGEEFEGAASYETRAPAFILQLLSRLGRWSSCAYFLGIGPLRVRIDLDPLLHLRHWYGLMLRRPSLWGRALMAYHRTAFRLKARLLTRAARAGLARGTSAAATTSSLLREPLVRRSLAAGILILFPSASELTERHWLELLARIEAYFAPRVEELLAAMPEQSLRDHGLIKLCKVAFGTIVGRTSVRDRHERDDVEFIFNTLRLAFSWGVTYPLVDNVLDSAKTSPETRGQLVAMLRELFGGDGDSENADRPCPTEDGGVREVRRRLREVLSLVPADRLPQARRALLHLLESHQRDAKRRLSALPAQDAAATRMAVLVDTALKAALVRLATMEVCGITVDEETVARNLVRSLFNQLGDDLWDVYEDADDDRVTPFTLYLTRRDGPNPVEFYLGYTVLLAKGLSRRRQTAAFLGFAETLRDSLLTVSERRNDPLGVAAAISQAIDRAGGGPVTDLVTNVPHVDFDAVLFAFEAVLFDLVPPRCESDASAHSHSQRAASP